MNLYDVFQEEVNMRSGVFGSVNRNRLWNEVEQ